MLDAWFGYEAKRKRLLKQLQGKSSVSALQEFLSIPFPSPQEEIKNIKILSVDFETTGLHPGKDQILSIGHVGVENNEIKLATASHKIILTDGELNEENVIIHQITDDRKAQGDTLKQVIENLLVALAGKVMLVHFAAIEKTFFRAACLQLYGVAPEIPVIDTLALAKRRLDQRSIPYDPSELRLFNLREKYLLPRYNAHNALSDAVATAELFFAESGTIEAIVSPKLKQVLF